MGGPDDRDQRRAKDSQCTGGQARPLRAANSPRAISPCARTHQKTPFGPRSDQTADGPSHRGERDPPSDITHPRRRRHPQGLQQQSATQHWRHVRLYRPHRASRSLSLRSMEHRDRPSQRPAAGINAAPAVSRARKAGPTPATSPIWIIKQRNGPRPGRASLCDGHLAGGRATPPAVTILKAERA
ncbi:hypothetical protein NDU88_006475 [Pleurodeles waltl]|uniref:Uncharacterized protein n=1 Tax=Pleurodeles waltl TaxID=8319 RepID=A0AAV7RM52_PLEWA|nr:hypothetical protein NDU88_006475 [Pleurodeles waltl]